MDFLTSLTAQAWQNIIVVLIAIGGAIFTAWRIRVLDKQKREISQQSLHTDSYIRAVEQLGATKGEKPNLEMRLGGIYGLEKIARESENHYQQIIELLCAYIRENAQNHPKDEDRKTKPPRIDVQAALDVVSRRDTKWEENDFRPDLSRAKLQNTILERLHFEKFNFKWAHLEKANLQEAHLEGANLIEAHLEGAHLTFARLEGARLRNAHLEGASLQWAHLEEAKLNEAHLEGAKLNEAHLEGADLDRAHLEKANLYNAHLEGAHLTFARLEGANLYEANLEGASLQWAHLEEAKLNEAHLEGADLYMADLQVANLIGAKMATARDLTQEQIDQAFGDAATILPSSLTRPQHWPTRELTAEEPLEEWRKWRKNKKRYKPPK